MPMEVGFIGSALQVSQWRFGNLSLVGRGSHIFLCSDGFIDAYDSLPVGQATAYRVFQSDCVPRPLFQTWAQPDVAHRINRIPSLTGSSAHE